MGIAGSQTEADDTEESDFLTGFLNRFGPELDAANAVLNGDPRMAQSHKHLYQNHVLMGLAATAAAKTVGYKGVISEQREIAARLTALHREGVEFCQVEIYREPLDSGVADHHVLVYWYESAQNMGVAGFRLDWGVTGLFHRECLDMPQESLLESKECGLSPSTLGAQLLRMRGKEYSVVHFHCQHFCRILFDKAAGNARLGNELDRLERAGILITATALYRNVGNSSVNDEDCADSDERSWSLVYWHKDARLLTKRGLQIKWSAEGLGFAILSSEPYGILVRRRGCSTSPAVLRQQLHKVEGRPYEAGEWDDWHLMQWLFQQVLARGGVLDLIKRLEELAENSVEIAGVNEVLMGTSPGDDLESVTAEKQHALIYTYRAHDRYAVHLSITFSSEGISFFEAEEEPSDTLVLRMKPMMFACLQPQVLQQQLQAVQEHTFDVESWNSVHFCDQLFNCAPGRAIPGRAVASGRSARSHLEMSSVERERKSSGREKIDSSASSSSFHAEHSLGDVEQSCGSEDSFETKARKSLQQRGHQSELHSTWQNAELTGQAKSKVARPGRELDTLWQALVAHRAAAGEGSTISSTVVSPRSAASDSGAEAADNLDTAGRASQVLVNPSTAVELKPPEDKILQCAPPRCLQAAAEHGMAPDQEAGEVDQAGGLDDVELCPEVMRALCHLHVCD